MKLRIVCFCLLLGLTAFATPNERVLKTFNGSFPSADSVKWFDDGDGYQVHFFQNKMRCKIWYDAQGEVTKSIRYYLGSELPPLILARIQKRFEGKEIFGVTEISSSSDLAYHIILQDDKKWYEVTSDSVGNLVMNKKLIKAKG